MTVAVNRRSFWSLNAGHVLAAAAPVIGIAAAYGALQGGMAEATRRLDKLDAAGIEAHLARDDGEIKADTDRIAAIEQALVAQGAATESWKGGVTNQLGQIGADVAEIKGELKARNGK